jgi:hypothetical protein
MLASSSNAVGAGSSQDYCDKAYEFICNKRPGTLNREEYLAQFLARPGHQKEAVLLLKQYSQELKTVFSDVVVLLQKAIKQEIERVYNHPTHKNTLLQISQILAKVEMIQTPTPELQKDYEEACGKNGLKDNAFAQVDGEHFYIIICPGSIIAASGSPLRMKSQMMTIAHEISHHFDSADFPTLYEKARSCYKQRYFGQLSPALLEDNLRELVADTWSALAISHYKGVDTNLIRENQADQCDAEADDEHPDGRFRVEKVIRPQPLLNRKLGCFPAPNPDCGLI